MKEKREGAGARQSRTRVGEYRARKGSSVAGRRRGRIFKGQARPRKIRRWILDRECGKNSTATTLAGVH